MKKTIFKKSLAWVLTLMMVITFMPVMSFGAAGQTPAHSKTATDNGDGTIKLELSVTGDADTKVQPKANVNVVIVYDRSSSMTSNRVNGGNTGPRRADAAELVVYNFAHKLFSYKTSPTAQNIEMALVTFAVNGTTSVDWTADEEDIVGTDQDPSFSRTGAYNSARQNYSTNANGTNWQAALTEALDLLDDADGDPTFVILVTDGACTAAANETTIAPNNNRPYTDYLPFYNKAKDVALAVQDYDTVLNTYDKTAEGYKNNTTLFGIYAYGTEADLLDDLIYYSNNNGTDNPNMNGGHVDTPNYFNATDTDAFTGAIEDIFDQIVSTLGVTNVDIADGTTSNVQTSSGVVSLVGVVDDSYEYWISIPVTSSAGGYTFTRTNPSTGVTTTYTVTENETTGECTVTGGEETITVKGSVSLGQFKFKWEEATELSNGKTPPEAELNNGTVDWDLSPVGTLLTGATYSVSFDVYPSQTALDYKARLENGEAYEDVVPEEARAYVSEDGSIATNTEASLSYEDTRTTDGVQTTGFTNPPKVETESSKLTIEKEWEGASAPQLDEGLDVEVLADGDKENPFAEVNLKSPGWTAEIDISYGIIKNGEVLADAKGHDFSFAELGSEQYRWELHAPTVHPMIIDGKEHLLVKVDPEKGYVAPSGATTYEIDGATYYIDDAVSTLKAVNHRRSNLNLAKVVTGEGAPEDATFPFTMTVNNSKAENGSADDTSSDYYVWFSIRNNGTAVNRTTNATQDASDPNYYYAPSGSNITVDLKAGDSLRFTNLPSGTTYTFVEGDTSGFKFDKAESTGAEDNTFAVDGKTATGTIVTYNAQAYEVTYTNEYAKIDVSAKKTWVDNNNANGTRPTSLNLTLNGLPTGFNAPDPTITKEGNTWTYTWKDLPKYGDTDAEAEYTVTEGAIPSGYSSETTTVAPDGTITNTLNTGSLTIRKTATGATVPSGATFTITGPNRFSKTVSYSDFTSGSYSIDVPLGTYKVSENESSANVRGYTLSVEGNNQSKAVTKAGATFEIKNTYTKSGGYIPDEPVPLDLNGEDHFAYIEGYPDGTVQPEGNITRAEVATMIYRLLTEESRAEIFTSECSYSDVAAKNWFNKAIASMTVGKYVEGYPDGSFKPNQKITRAEFVTIVVRFLEGDRDAENPFTDIDGHWAQKYILSAVDAGWIDGYPDGTFRPQEPIKRDEAMKIMNTILHRGINEESELGEPVMFPDNDDPSAWYYYEVIEATNNHETEGERPDEDWDSNECEYVYDIQKYERPDSEEPDQQDDPATPDSQDEPAAPEDETTPDNPEDETTPDDQDEPTATDSIVGQWENTVEEAEATFVYTFNEDGTGNYDMAGTVKAFTYTIEGNTLSILYEGDTEPFELPFVVTDTTLTVKDSNDEDVVYNKK